MTRSKETQSGDSDLADDLLSGVPAISSFLGLPTRRVYVLLEAGALPAFKLGRNWHGRRSTLRAHIAKLESAKAG